MRFTALRERAIVHILAALMAVLVCAGSGHTGWDDPACDPIPVHHDHFAHRFSAGTQQTPPSDGHCYLCHALRLLHMGLTAHPMAATQTAAASIYRVDAHTSLGRAIGGPTLPRAPPALL